MQGSDTSAHQWAFIGGIIVGTTAAAVTTYFVLKYSQQHLLVENANSKSTRKPDKDLARRPTK
jgi:hypothetical protein